MSEIPTGSLGTQHADLENMVSPSSQHDLPPRDDPPNLTDAPAVLKLLHLADASPKLSLADAAVTLLFQYDPFSFQKFYFMSSGKADWTRWGSSGVLNLSREESKINVGYYEQSAKWWGTEITYEVGETGPWTPTAAKSTNLDPDQHEKPITHELSIMKAVENALANHLLQNYYKRAKDETAMIEFSFSSNNGSACEYTKIIIPGVKGKNGDKTGKSNPKTGSSRRKILHDNPLQAFSSPSKRRAKWLADEESKLIDLKGLGKGWKAISEEIPGRTPNACMQHYRIWLDAAVQEHEAAKLAKEISEKVEANDNEGVTEEQHDDDDEEEGVGEDVGDGLDVETSPTQAKQNRLGRPLNAAESMLKSGSPIPSHPRSPFVHFAPTVPMTKATFESTPEPSIPKGGPSNAPGAARTSSRTGRLANTRTPMTKSEDASGLERKRRC